MDVQNFIKHPYGTSTLTTFHSPLSQYDTFTYPTRTTCSHQPPYRKIQGGKTNTQNTRSYAHILGEQRAKTYLKIQNSNPQVWNPVSVCWACCRQSRAHLMMYWVVGQIPQHFLLTTAWYLPISGYVSVHHKVTSPLSLCVGREDVSTVNTPPLHPPCSVVKCFKQPDIQR